MMQALKDNAHFWNSIWISCGKPREGIVTQIKRCTNHQPAIKLREPDLCQSRMVECLTSNRNHRDVWKENKKMNVSSPETPPHIDGVTELEGIVSRTIV